MQPGLCLWMTARYPRQVATEHVDCESRSHEDGAYPESPIAMHASPVGSRARFTVLFACAFTIVFASRHRSSFAGMSRSHLPISL